MTASIYTLILSALLTGAGGGLLGTLLTHWRLTPKSSAEAHQITAAAIDQDWARFQREIARLVNRCERAEKAADKAADAQHACEQREIESQRQFAARESELKGRIIKLEAAISATGEARQRAAGIVAIERSQDRSGQ